MSEGTYAQPAPPIEQQNGHAPPPAAAAEPAPIPRPELADQLAAEGTKIQLAGGREVELRYTFASLRLLEARFGSLGGLERSIDLAANGRACINHRETPELNGGPDRDCEMCTQQGAVFSVLVDAIAPGLLHERVVHPDTGQTVRLGKDPELCGEQLDPAELGRYMVAWQRAFAEAMTNLGNGTAAVSAASPNSSPGVSGITQPPSSLAAPIGSSGA